MGSQTLIVLAEELRCCGVNLERMELEPLQAVRPLYTCRSSGTADVIYRSSTTPRAMPKIHCGPLYPTGLHQDLRSAGLKRESLVDMEAACRARRASRLSTRQKGA